eukprot:CAMPEP_0198520348 /NCGR_PEP_ID=MMETSP1462-20131121/20277_1 /TAXON_ID=1333877 /ORGANISM="Brandtodinium nutriculum, Strain RCC3387" /LENGTH=41 /DNA_ID= /DNA_START= /DNA_END= /DNA_ORIENTATION=
MKWPTAAQQAPMWCPTESHALATALPPAAASMRAGAWRSEL